MNYKILTLLLLSAPQICLAGGADNPLDALNTSMYRMNEALANTNQMMDQMDRLASRRAEPTAASVAPVKMPPSSDSFLDRREVRLFDGSSSGNLNKLATFLAEQLTNNRDLTNIAESRVAVTSFVNLENLRETNKIGLSLAELLIHKLQISGFKVVDFKAMGQILVSPTGDYVLSRNTDDLKNEYNIHYFLTGTLTKTVEGIVVNARLLDARNSLVASSAQAFIPSRDARKLMSEYTDGETERVVIGHLPIPQPNIVKLK